MNAIKIHFDKPQVCDADVKVLLKSSFTGAYTPLRAMNVFFIEKYVRIQSMVKLFALPCGYLDLDRLIDSRRNVDNGYENDRKWIDCFEQRARVVTRDSKIRINACHHTHSRVIFNSYHIYVLSFLV